MIEEKNLQFQFPVEHKEIKFDDTLFYRKRFVKLLECKGVDCIAFLKNEYILLEIKDFTGHEKENMYRIAANYRINKIGDDDKVLVKESLDYEVAKKVAMTLSCLY